MTGGASQLGLRRSLHWGATYDVILGLFIVFAGIPVLEQIGHVVLEPFLFRLSALPLFVLPALYFTASRVEDTAPFRLPVLWARGGGGLLLLGLSLLGGAEPLWIYLAIGMIDLGWAALHVRLWRLR